MKDYMITRHPIAGPHALAQRPKSERYEPPTINLEDTNNSQTLAIQMIGKNKRVLEVGTSTGYVTKVLRQLGNLVTGIEIDKDAGDVASRFCESMIIGDVEKLNLDTYFDFSSFDVVLLGDILEHLLWPGSLLAKLRKYLKPRGYLVVSLPNVCHGDLLLNLLNGDFRYTSMGLLDETHLRFFGRRNISKFFAANGYAIESIRRVHIPLSGTELKIDKNMVPAELLKLIEAIPDSDVYQFVVKAVPSDCYSDGDIPETDFQALFGAADEDMREGHEVEISLNSKHLQQADIKVIKLRHKMAQLQQAVANKEDQLLDAENRALNSELSVLDRDAKIVSLSCQLQQMNARVQSLEHEIAEIHRSIVWRGMIFFHNNFINRTLPQGTRRRRWYDQGLESVRNTAMK